MSAVSCVRVENGRAVLYVHGKPIEGMAYITYLTDRNAYRDFAEAGYRLFSFPVFFGSNHLNEMTQLSVFTPGIFDGEEPDFSRFDRDMEQILAICPEALVFPRVNVALSAAWEAAHPLECNDTGPAQHPHNRRACFSSDLWARETCRELTLFLEHVQAMPWRDSIVGYQVAGGNTEEWFSYDLRGSLGLREREKYAAYLQESGKADTEETHYRFLSEMAAGRILEFAHLIKELTARQYVVGCFYGYTLDCFGPQSNHHALRQVLLSADIDFICSPISYAHARRAGMDHVYMLPVDSVKLHGKLYFSENDSRTHLSRPVNDNPYYTAPVWYGPDEDTTLHLLCMHLARALVRGHACWWFDMWGGWYRSPRYMAFMEKARRLYGEAMALPGDSAAQVAVFVDEKALAKPVEQELKHKLVYDMRHKISRAGAPHELYLAEDAPSALTARHRAAILLQPAESEAGQALKALCAARGIALLVIDASNADVTTEALRDFYRRSGVALLSQSDAVIYRNESYLFLHTVEDGTVTLAVEGELYDVIEDKPCPATFPVKCGESYLFRVKQGDVSRETSV